ncbi:SCP2 sterol-binding domain-containing protein [Saccharopolyspora sp. TS4A08]|uniref:SCP2 sterol-binding domain-containing protein n=1 Tax=Saccharopolyspora ipomoeae TaxID=3042027 RepID=A0ABT6PTG2_9PSEU|nr:SCP2 sterol-binding domain-containing protein [Saccharopolyspora sp. TS4A08]MDI2031292.1 SCP2 sterol-binding domain-containing protein [Saccharopolyspora sp. TS4A08]
MAALPQSPPDPIATLGSVDPRSIDKAELVRLLRAASETATSGGLDLSSLTPEQFARLISRSSVDQLNAVLAEPALRESILDEIFRRMGEHYQPEHAKRSHAVVNWRIGKGDDLLHFECVLADGRCQVTKGAQHASPTVTITMTPLDFLQLTSGNTTAPKLVMARRVRLAGDIGFAVNLPKLFQIPKA